MLILCLVGEGSLMQESLYAIIYIFVDVDVLFMFVRWRILVP